MMKDTREFKRLLEEIRWLDAGLYRKNFLLSWERTLKEVQQVLYTAEALKWLCHNNISTKCFESGLAVLQTRDKLISAGDRLSFGLAANLLGLTVHTEESSEAEIPNHYLSLLTGLEFVGVHDTTPDPGTGSDDPGGYAYMTELSKALSAGSDDEDETGIKSREPGIINLQCHRDHPIQAMADMLILKQHFFSLERLAGKKIAILWDHSSAPVTSFSVPQGIAVMAARFAVEVVVAHPRGYDLNPQVIEVAQQHAKDSGGGFSVANSPDQAIGNADAVYSINWRKYLPGKNITGPEEWRCTPEKLKLSKDGSAFTMTPYDSGNYKSYIIAAMMLNNRFKEPAKLLANLRKRDTKRFVFY